MVGELRSETAGLHDITLNERIAAQKARARTDRLRTIRRGIQATVGLVASCALVGGIAQWLYRHEQQIQKDSQLAAEVLKPYGYGNVSAYKPTEGNTAFVAFVMPPCQSGEEAHRTDAILTYRRTDEGIAMGSLSRVIGAKRWEDGTWHNVVATWQTPAQYCGQLSKLG